MIVAGHNWTRFDGSSWTDLAELGPADADWTRVSCPTATFCAAINTTGQASTWNGTSWSDPTTVLPHAGSGLSCPTASYCLATDTGHHAVSYTHGQWNWYRTTPVRTRVFRISCVTAQFCVGTVNTGTTDGGVVIRRSHGQWSSIDQVGERGLEELKCVTTTFCAGIDANPGGPVYASVFDGSDWTNSNTGFTQPGGVSPRPALDITCPTTDKCVAISSWSGDQASIGTR